MQYLQIQLDPRFKMFLSMRRDMHINPFFKETASEESYNHMPELRMARLSLLSTVYKRLSFVAAARTMHEIATFYTKPCRRWSPKMSRPDKLHQHR